MTALALAYVALAYWTFWGVVHQDLPDSPGDIVLNAAVALTVGPLLVLGMFAMIAHMKLTGWKG